MTWQNNIASYLVRQNNIASYFLNLFRQFLDLITITIVTTKNIERKLDKVENRQGILAYKFNFHTNIYIYMVFMKDFLSHHYPIITILVSEMTQRMWLFWKRRGKEKWDIICECWNVDMIWKIRENIIHH